MHMTEKRAMTIDTPRLSLHPLEEADSDAMIALLTDKIVTKTYMVPDFASRDEAYRLFDRIRILSNTKDRFVYGIYDVSGLVGMINAVDDDGERIELGFALHPSVHNRGYATEALTAAMAELFRLGYQAVRAGAFPENAASLRVMEKCGMSRLEETERVTYRGCTYDCIMYERRA